jgi:hypothetical protein
VSTRLVEAVSQALASRTSRRGFLRRAALVGSALIANPAGYVLRPGSAYASLVLPADCPPGSLCRDGYTEFCCTTTGVNTCPPGSAVFGWWRAEGSGFCGGGPRYYMDCNSTSCGGCSCGSSGTCTPACAGATCHCAHDNCGLRKVGCTRFRYGQCNQHIGCSGPIICRVVTCVPPWEWDSSCTRTDARNDATASHDNVCLRPYRAGGPPVSTYVGVAALPQWTLRNSLSAGAASSAFDLGHPGDVPLMADWTGAGIGTAAVVRGVGHGRLGREFLRWYVRQIEGPGQPDLIFDFGLPGDIPVVGDWTGKGWDSAGVVRGNRWLLRNRNSTGGADLDFTFGQPGDIPVVGDWNGNGVDGIGVVRGNTWLLRHTASPGPAQIQFDFGPSNGIPVVGDWNGDRIDSPGRFVNGSWQLRNALSSGGPQITFSFGTATGRPVAWKRVTA